MKNNVGDLDTNSIYSSSNGEINNFFNELATSLQTFVANVLDPNLNAIILFSLFDYFYFKNQNQAMDALAPNITSLIESFKVLQSNFDIAGYC